MTLEGNGDAGSHAGSMQESLFAGHGEMATLMRATDWTKTPLGSPSQWPQSLRTVVRILLTSRYAMWMGFGPELTFFYNDAYKPTLGNKHGRALGAPAAQVWAEIWPAIGPRIDTVLKRGEATWDEGLLLLVERNGYPEESYHTFSYSPLPDDVGAIGGMLCVVTEVTERVIGKRRLALLREFAAQLSTASTTDGVFIAIERCLDDEARDIPFSLTYLFEDADSRRARLCSQTTLAVDHSAAASVLEIDDPRCAWPLAAVRDNPTGAVVELSDTMLWPGGPWQTAPRHALVLPIAQQGGAPPLGAFIAGLNAQRPLDGGYRDFIRLFVGQIAAGLANARAHETEHRRAEALAELDQAKTTFFSNVSHEFRTPLTLLLGPLTERLSLPDLAPDERSGLELMHRNVRRLQKLVNTMLDFSRIEAGREQATYVPTDLAEYTTELASVFHSATARAGLRLVVDCQPLGEDVYVDRDMWEKIVFNLISNAFKFTLRGEISVGLSRVGSHVKLTVADTGGGIPAHELPRIFERFHRVESTRGRTHEGTGMGLSLAAELTRLHGGTIAVDSQLDRGSVFSVTLPLGRAHLPAEHVQSEARRRASSAPEAFLEESLRWLPEPQVERVQPQPHGDDSAESRPRVLLADDNVDMRRYLKRLLEARWDVETASNGVEALRLAKRRPPNLVITDVMMPELDGFGLLAALRADERTRLLPVIMLSARAGEESRASGLQAGADDYLVKPFSARELLACVETHLLRTRLRMLEDAQARRLANVFAHAPVAIAIVRGSQHVYELANPHYLALVGRQDVVGKSIREALPELHAQGACELLDRVLATSKPFVGRSARVLVTREQHRPAQECFFDFVYQPILGHDGRPEAIAIVAFEVTELANARRAAEIANRSKDDFLAMLGHELRNPLAPILTALHLMELKQVPGADKERAVIERQVKHLVGLVDDLLDVSRITQGKIQLRREMLELADGVAQAIEMASPLLEQHRHDLRVDVPRQGLPVDADRARLSQIISNLLTNAAKYTKPGGCITVTGARQGADVVLKVCDTGIGIESEMLKRIFDPFAQERQALDRSEGGLGLGLAIVRSLVDLHDGSVRAESAGRGLGSEFTVRLPLARHGRVPAELPTEQSGIQRSLRDGPRVLVVDDNRDAAAALSETLQSAGYRTRCAYDAPSALRVGDEFDPDVAVIDLGLPVMDGFELARRFAEHATLRRVHLVAVTGYGQEQDRALSAAVGFSAHLIKPVDFDEMQRVLAQLAPLTPTEETAARSASR